MTETKPCPTCKGRLLIPKDKDYIDCIVCPTCNGEEEREVMITKVMKHILAVCIGAFIILCIFLWTNKP